MTYLYNTYCTRITYIGRSCSPISKQVAHSVQIFIAQRLCALSKNCFLTVKYEIIIIGGLLISYDVMRMCIKMEILLSQPQGKLNEKKHTLMQNTICCIFYGKARVFLISATPFLMSPIYDFWLMSRLRSRTRRSSHDKQALPTLATHPQKTEIYLIFLFI